MDEKKEKKEDTEESEPKVKENSVAYQRAITVEWVDGLMQRIQQSLISSTPLIMCEKDVDALDFLVLAASCAEPKTIVERISEMTKEGEENKSTHGE